MNSENTATHKIAYSNIDIAKFIAAFLVITIHCPLLTCFGANIELMFVSTIPRLAVPFFFACSGFFFFNSLSYENGKIINNKRNRHKLIKYIKRIVIMYVIWSIIYLFICQIPNWYSTGWLSPFAFVDYLIGFFKNGSYYHLWYILDLIYATVLGYVLLSLFKKKNVVIFSVVLYIIGMFSYSYSWIDFPGVTLINSISRIFGEIWNSTTRAFPLMTAGYIAGTTGFKLKSKTKFILFVISFICLLTEVACLIKFTSNKGQYSYVVFTIPCEIFLFMLLLKNKQLKCNHNKELRNASTVIYCVHPLIMNIFSLIPAIDSINSIIKYTLVAGISALLAFAIINLSQKKALKVLRYLY